MSLITATRRASHFPSAVCSIPPAVTEPRFPHWIQRLTLARHNLHIASQTGNFTFFTYVQARHYCEGTDDMAILFSILGDETESLFKQLDNLNCGIAFAFEDAFKAVYNSLECAMMAEKAHDPANIARAQADLVRERKNADETIDKMMSLAVTIIQQYPLEAHDTAASVFLIGTTFVADVIQVCLNQFEVLELCIELADFQRAETAMEVVRRSVSASNSAYKGILYMMEATEEAETLVESDIHSRRSSVATQSTVSSTSSNNSPTSETSGGSGVWAALRRMSSAIGAGRDSVLSTALTPPSRTSNNPNMISRPASPSSKPQRKITAPQFQAQSSPDPPAKAVCPPSRLSFSGVDPFAPKNNNTRRRYASGAFKSGTGVPLHMLSPIAATPGTSDEPLLNPFEDSFAPPEELESPTGIDTSRTDNDVDSFEKMSTPGLSGSVSSSSDEESEDAFINTRASSYIRTPSVAMMAAALKPEHANEFQDVTESLMLMEPPKCKLATANTGVIDFVERSISLDNISYDVDPLHVQSGAYLTGGQRGSSRRGSTMGWHLHTARKSLLGNPEGPLRSSINDVGP